MSAWELIAPDSGKLWRNRQKMQVANKKCKQKPNTGNAFMIYSDIIAREVDFLTLLLYANRKNSVISKILAIFFTLYI